MSDWKKTYQKYLRKQFVFACDETIFTKHERSILNAEGAWFDALVRGEIHPVTEDQIRFVQCANGQAEAHTKYERAWAKYQARCEFEELKNGTPRFQLGEEGDDWIGPSRREDR